MRCKAMSYGELERFIPLSKHSKWTVFLDTENVAVPYVLINNQALLKKMPKNTEDLMNMHVQLFSGEKLLKKYLNSKGELMMATDLNQEIDQLLAMIEEVIKIALRIRDEKKELEKSTPTKDLRTADDVIEKLDEKMNDINNVKSDISYKLNIEEQEDIQEKVIKNEKLNDRKIRVASNDEKPLDSEVFKFEKEKEEIKNRIERLQKQLDEKKNELEQIDFKNPTMLTRFGDSLIELDRQIKELGDRITDFVSRIPETVQKTVFSFLIQQLDNLSQSVLNLKDHLNQKISEQNTIIAQTDQSAESKQLSEEITTEKVIEKEMPVVNPESEVEKQSEIVAIETSNSTVENSVTNGKTAKDLLSVVEEGEFFTMKDLILRNMQQTFMTMGESIEECSRRAIEQEKFVGLQTEIDPQVSSFESISGNEQAGVKTVASVKEELEEVTLTEYSESMENAYQHGLDPDPNVATDITKEEWELQLEESQYDPWEQQM